MIRIKVYDKDFNPLTTLLDIDYNNLTHTQEMGRVGSAQFTMELRNQKINERNLRHYNRIEVVDETGVRFVGYIDYKKIVDNVITIRCSSLIGILKKRILNGQFLLTGVIDGFFKSLLTSLNNYSDTTIVVGDIDTGQTVSKRFNDTTFYGVLEIMTSTVNAEFEVDTQRRLNIKPSLGNDLRDSVKFIHDYKRPEQNTLLNVDYEDDGDTITTRSVGATSGGLRVAYLTQFYSNRYGVLERFVNLSNSATQQDLNQSTLRLLRQNVYTVNLSIKPEIPDNFEVGDFVKVYIRNRLNTLNADYQILRKVVQYKGCLLYTSPSPRDRTRSRMPSSA